MAAWQHGSIAESLLCCMRRQDISRKRLLWCIFDTCTTAQVLKSALQIVAAERSIKNAAASVAAQRQAASPDAAPPTAKRFAAAAVPVVGGDAAAPARPVAKAVSQGGLSPSASGVSAAMNNALFPTPSVSTLQPAPSAGSPSRGFGGGMETQRSTFSYGAASLTAAASDSTPAMTDAIADVTALEVRLPFVAYVQRVVHNKAFDVSMHALPSWALKGHGVGRRLLGVSRRSPALTVPPQKCVHSLA